MIYVDTREHNQAYILKFMMAKGIEAESFTFPQTSGADYLITAKEGSCAIQRKVVVSEMIGELDEIMYQIIPRLKNFTDHPILLLEENFGISKEGYLYNKADNRETQFLATSYYGYLETIRKIGVDVVTTRDLNSSIWWMIAMHGYLEKNHYPKHTKYHSVEEQAVGLLSVIPGVGEERAKKALKHSSIRGMVGMKSVKGLTGPQCEKLQKVLQWRGE